MVTRKPKAEPASEERIRFSQDALARVRSLGRQKPDIVVNPFAPMAGMHPHEAVYGVRPDGLAMDERKKQIAQDEQPISAFSIWAGNSIYSSIGEGLAFMGYPLLSEYAQRPEYRRIVEVIATEMTRKWIDIKTKSNGEEDKSDKINVVKDAMTKLRVRDAFRQCAEYDGFFGRGHLYIDTGSTDDLDELKTSIGGGGDSVSRAKVKRKALKALRPVEPVWTYPTSYNASDPLKATWYNPESWFVMGKQLHSSRLLTFIGREVPDLLKPAYSFGGLSLTQMAKPYVDNWLRTRQGVADIINSFSTPVLSTKLSTSTQLGGDELFERAAFFNQFRTNQGLMLVDKATEDFKNVSAPLGTLDALQAQTQEHMCSVSGIPVVKLLGIQPTGLNASSEGELRTFYDWIHAFQEKLFRRHLTTILDLIQLSEFGEVDPDITFDFEPLWSLDEAQLATVQKTKADMIVELVDGGMLSPLEARTEIAADPDMPFSTIEVADIPEPPDEEDIGMGGDPSQPGAEGGQPPAENPGAQKGSPNEAPSFGQLRTQHELKRYVDQG